MQRAGDGKPVLARRGALRRAGATSVRLPKVRFRKGNYRFSIWIVGEANPGPLTVRRSSIVTAR
jgi:hypothetical protein